MKRIGRVCWGFVSLVSFCLFVFWDSIYWFFDDSCGYTVDGKTSYSNNNNVVR